MSATYETLVKALSNPKLTPEMRKLVLAKLTAMNEELLAKPKSIDLDDLLDDIEEPDELDIKLDKIAALQRKIMIGRRHKK